VVWGMPGIVAREGLADEIVPLDEIAPEIIRLVSGGRPRAASAATRTLPRS
jgi:chemotaxis response regulator CheB